MEIVEIEGSLVTFKSVTETKKMKLQDFTNEISTFAQFKTPMLSKNILQYKKAGEYQYYMIFRKGTTERVTYLRNRYTIDIPDTIFIWRIQLTDKNNFVFVETFMYWVNKEKTKVVTPLMPNLYSDKKICWGNNIVKFSLALLEERQEEFFKRPFNNDLNNNMFDFKAWSVKCKEDPKFTEWLFKKSADIYGEHNIEEVM